MKKYVYGVDIGGTNIKIGLFSIEPIKKSEVIQIETPILNQRSAIFDDIIKAMEEVNESKQISFDNILGIGIAVPCPTIECVTGICPNVDLSELNILEEFKKRLNKNLYITVSNDANMAALGEFKFIGDDYNNAAFYTLGTGVGGGVIIDGKVIEGINGTAGEFGHMLVGRPSDEICGCGKSGCLEQIAGTKGMLNLAKEYSKYKKSLVEKEDLTIKDIYDYAKMGDVVANRVVDTVIDALAKSASILAVIVNPDIFIIGGGIANAGDFLIDKLTIAYKKYARFNTGTTQFVLARLKNDAGTFGAAHNVYGAYRDKN